MEEIKENQEKVDYTDPKAIAYLQEHVNYYSTEEAPKYRILWLGKYIRTRKGKTVWDTPGRAKAAFINFVKNSYIMYHLRKELGSKDQNHWLNDEHSMDLINQHIAAGLVTFPET